MNKAQLQSSLQQYFSQLGDIGDQIDWSLLKLKPQVRHYAKGEYLINQGKRAPELFFLHNGLLRYVSISEEGKEFTQSFAVGPRVAGSTYAMVTGNEAAFSIEALQDTLVLAYDWQTFYQQMKACPAFLQTYICLLEQLFIGKEERENALAKHSAEQRYLDFITRRPDVAEHIPLQYIASYISVTPVALSRIRQRLKST